MVNFLTFRLRNVIRRSIVQFVDFSLYPFWAIPIFEQKIQFLQTMANIMVFHGQKVREVWRGYIQSWIFSIIDIVFILIESSDPRQDALLNFNWGTICTPLPMTMVAKVGPDRLEEIEGPEFATK